MLYYRKRVEVGRGRGEELVQVAVKEMRMREMVEMEWRTCMEVDLKLLIAADSCGERREAGKRLSAEEIVERWELLRDAWLQLAADL